MELSFSTEGNLQFLFITQAIFFILLSLFLIRANTYWAKLGIDGMNSESSKNLIDKKADQIKNVKLFGGDGPLWYRGYADDSERTICKKLDDALQSMNAVRLVCGHTPQIDGKILSRCGGRILVIDVGISQAYWGHSAALEIIGDTVNALYPDSKPIQLAP